MSTQKITATNYSAILSTVTSILTTYYGYGQASKSVVAGNRITAVDWGNLYNDINRAIVHQTGSSLPFPNITSGSVLTQQYVNSLTNYVIQIDTNKTQVAANQLTSAQVQSTRSSIWGGNIVHQTLYTWPNATAAQSFFNQGSYLQATILRAVNSGTSAENIAWSSLIYNAAQTISGSPQLVDYRLSDYNGSFTPYSYSSAPPDPYTIDFAYTKINPYTILGSITFNVQNVNNLHIGVLPLAGFIEYQSNNIYGGTLAPSPDAVPLQTLDVGGATLYPFLNYTPFTSSNNVPQLVASTVKTLTITNTGTGICTISGAAFFGQLGSGITGTASLTTTTLKTNESTNVSISINTLNAVKGTYPSGYVEVYSDSAGGSILKAKVPITVTSPAFTVTLSPNPVVAAVVTADPVITHFSFGAGITGNIYSYTASVSGTDAGRVAVTALAPIPTQSTTPDNKIYDNLLSTTFLPPTSTVLGDVTGTFNATLNVTFVPYDYTQTAYTISVPLTYNVNIPNGHLGDWLSPKDIDNAVFGASYDIINGVRTLTLGFGMGQDGGPPLNKGGSTYATASTLGINGDPYPSLGIPLFPATNSSKYGNFLNAYGSWPTVNGGGGHQSTFDLTYTINVPVAGNYTTQLSGVSTSVLFINGNQISIASDPKSSITKTCYLNAGTNTIRIITSSAGGKDAKPGFWTSYKTADGVEVKREWTPDVVGIPWLGSVGVTIVDSNGNLRWSTRYPVRNAYTYWAEVSRIPLTQGSHVYKSGDYLVKTNDFALGFNYGHWLGTDDFKGHTFVVADDGRGNIVISMNPWEGKVSTGDQELNRTLAYSVSLPYYYSQLSTRFSNLEAPFAGTKTRFFSGFKSSGTPDVRVVNYPFVYTEPPRPNAPPGEDQPKTFWANLVVALEIAAVAFVVATAAVTVALYVTGLTTLFSALTVIETVVAAANIVVEAILFVAALCFTKDSKISMADGTTKPICEVQVGDLVFNYDKTSINRVTYIEKTNDLAFGQLYSVTKDEEPFATVNHPLYINGKLSAVYPDNTYKFYPWLGKLETLIPDRVVPANGQEVYNLLTDGDGTYIVNGYGTTTIQGDGGWGRLLVEQGITTPERLSEVLIECATESKEVSYGAYICNKALGKLDIKFINKTFGKVMDSKEPTRSRRAIKYTFKTVGKVAVYFAERKMRK